MSVVDQQRQLINKVQLVVLLKPVAISKKYFVEIICFVYTYLGSTRFFQSDGNTKEKRSIKDAPAAFGNKIKSLFSRK